MRVRYGGFFHAGSSAIPTHTSKFWLTLSQWYSSLSCSSIPLLLPAPSTLGLLGKREARLSCQGNFPKFPFLEEKIKEWPRSAVWREEGEKMNFPLPAILSQNFPGSQVQRGSGKRPGCEQKETDHRDNPKTVLFWSQALAVVHSLDSSPDICSLGGFGRVQASKMLHEWPNSWEMYRLKKVLSITAERSHPFIMWIINGSAGVMCHFSFVLLAGLKGFMYAQCYGKGKAKCEKTDSFQGEG